MEAFMCRLGLGVGGSLLDFLFVSLWGSLENCRRGEEEVEARRPGHACRRRPFTSKFWWRGVRPESIAVIGAGTAW